MSDDLQLDTSNLPAHFRGYVEYLKRVPALTLDQQNELGKMMLDEEEPQKSREWAKERLWLDSCRFVIYVRMKLRNSLPFVPLDDMDIIQEGNVAAGAALARWNPEKGTLTTWLQPHIRGALLNYVVRETRVEQTAISLDAVVGSDTDSEALAPAPGDDEFTSVGDLLLYEHHVFDDPEIITEYGQVRRLLVEQHGTDGWGDLAADYLIGDTNIRELAAKYKVTVPTIYNRMRKMGF